MTVFRQFLRVLFGSIPFLSIACDPAYAIIGGTPVGPDAFGSSVILKTPSGGCSATLIGPKVLVTAASCIADGREMRVSQGETKIRCDRHPDYKALSSSDVALCLLDAEIADLTSERIAVGSAAVFDKVTLVGFGCTKGGGVDGQLGRLNAGEARSTKPPTFEKGFLAVKGAALCFGDGGGGAYVQSGSGYTLIAVNSASDLREKSLLWPINTPEFIGWAKKWSVQNNAKICGIDEAACRVGGGLSISPEAASTVLAQVALSLTNSSTSLSAVIATADNTSDNQNDLQRVTKIQAKKDSTVRELATLVCGDEQNADYFDQFEQYQSRAGTSLNRETKFDRDQVVDFPACGLARSLTETFVTVEGDYPWRYWLIAADRKLTPPWRSWRRQNGSVVKDANSEYFLDALAFLNPDINILQIPANYRLKVPLVPRKNTARQINVALPPSVQPIFSLQSAGNNCNTPPQLESYPFDVPRLLDVLRLNKEARTQARPPVSILIADSGLFGAGRGVFSESVLLKTGSIEEFAQSVDPILLLEGNDASHGTEVASVALGGNILGRTNAIFPRIQLVPKAIYRKFSRAGVSWVGTEEDLFAKLLLSARQHGVSIVNLSLKTEGAISALAGQLGDSSNLLFVVASGNAEGGAIPRLGTDGSSPIYPAMYGGESAAGLFNLIAVAALHWDGAINTFAIAPFSHNGREWVELAAPGCKIPVVSYNTSTRAWTNDTRSGTSFAAPLVSYAAALVKAERGLGGSPLELKRRLLVSSDLDPALKAEVQDGRILNILKAAAIENDLIELVKGRRLVIGSISFVVDGVPKSEDQYIKLNCGTAGSISLRTSEILKIRPRYASSDNVSLAKIYARPIGALKLFRSLDCELPPTLRIVMRDYERDSEESFSMSEIADVVRKDRLPD